MAQMCTAEFQRLSMALHDTHCDSHSPFITFTNPLKLQNWTMPVWEYALMIGIVVMLVHAVSRYRRYGDASNLVVWVGSALCILIFEPIAYFPQYLGTEKAMGLTFIWNQFSAQIIYDRMALFGIGMYSSYFYLAYCLVQRSGIFEKYGKVVGAVTTSFAVICVFEPVEHVGPTLKWWVWNTEVPSASPAFGVVPMLNLLVFNMAMPVTVVVVARWLNAADLSPWKILRNIAIAAVALWPVTFVFMAPAAVAQLAGMSLKTARAIETIVLLVVFAAVGIYALIGAYRARRHDPSLMPVGVDRDFMPLAASAVAFVMAVVFWIAAMPQYLTAANGVTANGAQASSLPVAVVTGVLGLGVVALTCSRTASRANPATAAGARQPASSAS